MKRKLFFTIVLSFLFTLCLFAFTACENGYTIKFETDGGSKVSELSFSKDIKELQLPTPLKKGYNFEGWYLDAEYSIPFDVNAVNGNVTVYAKWSPKAVYTVEFETYGGTEYQNVAITDGDYITLPTPEREGDVFVGWYKTADCSGEALNGTFTPSSDIKLYAKYEAYSGISVNLEANGGIVFVKNYRYSGEAITLPVPSNYGYKFLGWYKEPDFSGEIVSVAENLSTSITYYAKWEKVSYLYLYYGEATDYVRYEYAPTTVVDSSEFFTPEPKIVNGFSYAFKGWVYEDISNNYSIGEPVGTTVTLDKEDTIIVATYEAMAKVAQNENGDIITTGNVALEYFKNGGLFGAISGDFEFDKGVSGGVGVAFRMKMSGESYAFQDEGSTYLSVVFVPKDGSIQIGQVVNGTFEHFSTLIALSSLPSSFQQKYNDNAHVSANLKVVLKAESFEIYIDNEFVKTIDASNIRGGRTNDYGYEDFTGTNYGFRSSVTGAIIKNLVFTPTEYTKITFNYGIDDNSYKYYESGSDITFIAPSYMENGQADGEHVVHLFDGWYTQKDGGEKVTVAESNISLFARYTDKTYCDTTFDFNGEYSFNAGEKADTGVQLDFSYDFTIETTVRVSSLNNRYVIANTWDNTDPKRFLNIEIHNGANTMNSFRVQMGKNGSGSSWQDYWSVTTNPSYVATANTDYLVKFVWSAEDCSFKLYVNGTLYISGTHTYLKGLTTSGTVCFGAGDHRGGTTFKAITVKGFKLTVLKEKNTEITLPNSVVPSGKTFDGWYKDASYTQPITDGFEIVGKSQSYAKIITN